MTASVGMIRFITALFLVLGFTAVASADLASVYWQRAEPRGGYMLSTHVPVSLGNNVSASVTLWLSSDRYVIQYSEHKRIDANKSEVTVEREFTGRNSAGQLDIGKLMELGSTKNGKPEVTLVLDRQLGSLAAKTTVRLGWTYVSFVPKSVAP